MTTLFRQEVNANKAKIEDEMKTQFVSSPTFTSMLKKISRIILRVKMIFPKAKQSKMAGSSSLPSLAMSSSDMGKKADKGKKKMDGEKKKTDKGKGKGNVGTPSSSSSPPATSPMAPGQTAAQPSHMPQVFIDEDREKNCQFTICCHVRSYLYPVGTPIYWFRSAIELVCVLKDLVETHKQACSTEKESGKGSYSILHGDMSLWNLLMERKWASKELQKLCGESGNLEGIHRGLLIDWGFGILEHSTVATPFQPLMDEDVYVYQPAEPSPCPPFDGLDEGDNMRHCHILQ
ncbi:hypothetical protein M405DRAFT_866940 [Rhizopogon salebrosus TDB-379]|nr:hypothetical protein M405DRAFT_866940 [Rhizopogon salebrosus TDB-379]